ncbi:hypothetical protein KUL72_29790 [Bradyrhizobium arachidis]|nr:hypothetical protein [Bradyrhizobium arachidis]UVO35589.1 hypothetical protein KUL72_29790 [Bradyrhizobium arachidis]
MAGWSDALYTIAGYVLYTTNSTYLTWEVATADDVFAVPSGFHIRLPA